MQLAVNAWATRFDVSYVKEPPIGPAGESYPECMTDCRTGAIATGKVQRLTVLLPAVWSAEASDDASICILERPEFGPALDANARPDEVLNEQAFVLVLRKDQHVGVRTKATPHLAKRCTRLPLPAYPQVGGGEL